MCTALIFFTLSGPVRLLKLNLYPALPISADNVSSIIKLQAEGQKRIWNNYAMALIRLKDYRINIKQKIVNSGCKS